MTMPSHLSGILELIKAPLASLYGRLLWGLSTLAAVVQALLRVRRIWASALVLAFLATAVFSILAYRAFAIGGGQVFDGTKAPGAHEWWTLNQDNVESDFCGKCHAKIVAEVAATRAANSHPIATCEGCHGVKTAGHGHVAVARKCADCHQTQAQELRDDAHASFITDIGESADRPSWSCKACHTKVEIDMQVTPISPIRLILGGVNPDGGQPIVTPTVVPTPTASGNATPAPNADVQQGQTVFNGFCNSCHPSGKKGFGPAIVGASASQIRSVVRSGIGSMPAFGTDKIGDDQLNSLVAYIGTLR